MRGTLAAVIGVSVTLVITLLMVTVLLITGGEKAAADNAILLGALVALGGVFTTQLVNSAQELARRQNEALQKYLERMQDLMIKEGLNLGELPIGDPQRAMVEATTRAVIDGLDTHRLYALLQFLQHGGFLSDDPPPIRLRGVYLRGLNLAGDDLSGVNLSGVHFAGWPRPNLRPNLRGIKLKDAILREVDFGIADLSGADLSGADLSGAKISTKQITACKSPKGATMPNGQKYEDWLKSREDSGEDGENSGHS